ncbi:MAG: hypothetical protein LBC02_11710, partial [Planctomycetaceae bacterium]|nr:hypothetical protein [Planctomycetaceae bacterium]
MKIHRFNKQGIEAFRNELQRCRENITLRPDVSLLENKTLTEIIADVDLQPQIFQTKGEAGLFLREVFQQCGLTNNELMSDTGLWSWLSLFYFDSVCPKDKKIESNYRYIFEAGNYRRYYRHNLFVSWQIMNVAGENNHRLLSDTEVSVIGKLVQLVMERLYLLRIPCFFEVLDKVYYNPKTRKAYSSCVNSSKPGNICNRFPTVIQQLSLTYDMPSLTADKLIELLGDEFQL